MPSQRHLAPVLRRQVESGPPRQADGAGGGWARRIDRWLGETAFSGGEGLVTKTIVGAIIIVCVTIGLVAIIPVYWQTLATGSVLLIAVALNHLLVREKVQA
jgi:hypothetical protein